MTDIPAKTFSKQQATYLLAHSINYDKETVEVEEKTFRRMLGLPMREEEHGPARLPDWRRDEADGPCPEKEYHEWRAYFHPMAGEDVDVTDILFDRKELETAAEMTAANARHRYGKATLDQVDSQKIASR